MKILPRQDPEYTEWLRGVKKYFDELCKRDNIKHELDVKMIKSLYDGRGCNCAAIDYYLMYIMYEDITTQL